MLSEWIESKIQLLQNCVFGQDCTKHLHNGESGFGKGSTNVQAAIVYTSAASESRLHFDTSSLVTLPNVCEKKKVISFAIFSLSFEVLCKGGREINGDIDWSSWLTEVKSAEFLLKLRVVTGEVFPLVLKIRMIQLIKCFQAQSNIFIIAHCLLKRPHPSQVSLLSDKSRSSSNEV